MNPTTEKPICDFHEATVEDIDVAVAAARAAFEGPWSKVTPEDRGKLINKFVQLIERDAAQIAAVEALNNGKSVFMAGLDVGYCASTFRLGIYPNYFYKSNRKLDTMLVGRIRLKEKWLTQTRTASTTLNKKQ